ncbi:hypothetical protein PR048_019500 [Dryococelus australis]|uniref:Cytochrome P450 n=1 Tax=Dryococelus australis TaxID=614101 RepID=A0ABQ9H3M4_9NEOP|nr:hypothetical protein PR048_019500 [Dryococelus australis]
MVFCVCRRPLVERRDDRMVLIFSSFLADVAFVVTICFGLLYLYSAYAFAYWRKRGVYYLQPSVFFGNMGLVALQVESAAECFRKVYERGANQSVVGIFAAFRPLLVARDLHLVRSVLVKDAHAFLDRSTSPPDGVDSLLSRSLFGLKGRKWRHFRTKLTPTFTSGKMRRMFHLLNECGSQLVPCIDDEMAKGDTLPDTQSNSVLIKDAVARYSTDVIASCAFGVNANALADPTCEFRTIMRKVFEPAASQKLATLLSIFLPWLRKILRLNTYDDSVPDFVRRTFWDVVEYRKRNNVTRHDFVDLLVQIQETGEVRADDAQDLEELKRDSEYMSDDNADKLDTRWDDDDIVAQAFIFIGAGFETSSSVVSFTLYELAMHLDIQDRLREKIRAVIDQHDSVITYDAIAEMTYLDMVVSEAQRKYPIVPVLDRTCLSDYKIQGTDITIEKGIVVLISVLGIHYDPEIYPDPDKFDPERFSQENKSKRSHFAYLPFGEGPRICIGMRFGLMQVKTALVHILTNFQVKPCMDTPKAPLEMSKSTGILVPKQDIVLSFIRL